MTAASGSAPRATNGRHLGRAETDSGTDDFQVVKEGDGWRILYVPT